MRRPARAVSGLVSWESSQEHFSGDTAYQSSKDEVIVSAQSSSFPHARPYSQATEKRGYDGEDSDGDVNHGRVITTRCVGLDRHLVRLCREAQGGKRQVGGSLVDVASIPKFFQSLVVTADQKPSLPRKKKGLATGLCLPLGERRDRSPRAGEALI